MARHKQVGNRNFSEPQLPSTRVVKEDDVLIEYYRGDHGPPHLHVYELASDSHATKIGQNGKVISGSPALTHRQEQVVENNRPQIRKVLRKIARWHWYNRQ